MTVHADIQIVQRFVFLAPQVQMQNRVFRPVFLLVLDSQTLEQLLLPLEIGFHRR